VRSSEFNSELDEQSGTRREPRAAIDADDWGERIILLYRLLAAADRWIGRLEGGMRIPSLGWDMLRQLSSPELAIGLLGIHAATSNTIVLRCSCGARQAVEWEGRKISGLLP
jgi:hypothetical protein